MLASYTFIPIFAPAITLYKATANGLVAQLNSALDYGSRGYWFESSRGHSQMAPIEDNWRHFFHIPY